MVNFKEEISKLIAEQIQDLTAEEIQSMIEVPQDAKMGDYAFPCFKLAKTLRKAPPLIARGIADAIRGNAMFEKVEQVNAYVNMFISREEFVGDVVSAVLAEKEDYGKSNVGEGKTVIVEYSSPNIAKPFHIGHIRSTVIGNSIKARKEQLKAGTLEMAEGFANENISYAGDNGTTVIPLPVSSGKKRSPFGQGAESTPHQVLKDMIK